MVPIVLDAGARAVAPQHPLLSTPRAHTTPAGPVSHGGGAEVGNPQLEVTGRRDHLVPPWDAHNISWAPVPVDTGQSRPGGRMEVATGTCQRLWPRGLRAPCSGLVAVLGIALARQLVGDKSTGSHFLCFVIPRTLAGAGAAGHSDRPPRRKTRFRT